MKSNTIALPLVINIRIYKQVICGTEFETSIEKWNHRIKAVNATKTPLPVERKLLTSVNEQQPK